MERPMIRRFPFPSFAAPGALSGLLSVVLGLAGCQLAAEDAVPAAPPAMPPAQVTVTTLDVSDVPLTLELPALLAGSREVEIRARVAGILETRNYEEGSRVTAGQSLYTLDSKPTQATVARIQADLAAARARHAQAVRNLKRLAPLRKEGAVAQKDYDDAVSNESITEADVEAVRARLNETRLELEYARVESPIDGVAGRSLVSEGTLVPGPEMLLTRVTQLDPIHARFGLSQVRQSELARDAAAGRLQLPRDGRWNVELLLPDGSAYPHRGAVNFADVRIDASTGTGEMQGVIPNPEGTLRPGQFVRVRLGGATRRQVIVVPQRAVLERASGKYVYLASAGDKGQTVARQAAVKVGDWVPLGEDGNENGWVVREGLKPGDTLIVDGVARIFFDGAPVATAQPGA